MKRKGEEATGETSKATESKKAKVEEKEEDKESSSDSSKSDSSKSDSSDSDSDSSSSEEEEEKVAAGWETAFKSADYSKAFPLLFTEISKEVGPKPFSLKKLEGSVLDKLEKVGGKKRKDLRKIFKKEVRGFHLPQLSGPDFSLSLLYSGKGGVQERISHVCPVILVID